MYKLFLSALLIFPLIGYAQDYGVKGRIIDASSNQPLEFATVSLLNASDESLVTGVVTGFDGQFDFKADAGKYIVRVQFVTFETQNNLITLTPDNPIANLGKMVMLPSQQELAEIVVKAERTQMEMNLDKKVYNVGKDLSNLGGTASDLLDNLPSVTVDVEGNVQLRGSSNVRILINGKPSGLVGLSGTDALRQLQGNLIESVEIITNPSARYDAEGQAGIINIILKKERSKGINGSFQVNTGYPHNHGGSINLNFRRDWVNFFVNYGINYNKAPGKGESFQQFNRPDTAYNTQLNREHYRGGISHNARFGADFNVGKNSTLTTSFLYRYSDELNDTDLTFQDRTTSNDIINNTLRNDMENEGDENLEYSLNYTKNFLRKDHKLTADIQYQNNNELEQSEIVQSEGSTEFDLTPALFQKVRNSEGEERLMIQSDYVMPFGTDSKFEAGFRSTMRNVKNDIRVEEKADELSDYTILDQYSTNFSYKEQVHAVYGIVSDQMDQFSWQVGLRTESTNIQTLFQDTGANREWNYVNFFPSAFLTYKLQNQNQVQLSYSRRINRPRFRELNPLSSFSDNRNFRIGNPELQPEFTDSYELGFLQNMQSSSIYYGVYYRNTTQLIQRVTLRPDENGIRTAIPVNIGTNASIGAETNVAYDFSKWYRITGNFNFYRSETQGSVGDSISLAATTVTFSTRLSNNFKVGDLFSAQVNVTYRAPQIETQGRRQSLTSIDLGITRDIWSNKGTVSLSVRDVFNTRKYRSITDLPTLYEETTWQWRTGPQFILTLSYRLNQKKQKSKDGERGDYDEDF